MGRIWFWSRAFTTGALIGGAVIVHFTHKQISAMDFEIQHALEDLAAMERRIAARGADQLRATAMSISRQTDALHAKQAAQAQR